MELHRHGTKQPWNQNRHGGVAWQAPPGLPRQIEFGRAQPFSVPSFPSCHMSKGDAVNNKIRALDTRRKAPASLDTPTDLSADAVSEISAKLNKILATTFALYLKTKNFHWHVSGPHFRAYHLLLDEQGEQIFASTDDIAERVRKIGGTTLRSIGQISKLQGIEDNDDTYVAPGDMLH